MEKEKEGKKKVMEISEEISGECLSMPPAEFVKYWDSLKRTEVKQKKDVKT